MDMDRPEAIGARLEELRLALGYHKAVDFCRMIGIAATTWHNYETGIRRISLDEATKLVARLGVPFDWTYRGVERDLPKSIVDKLQAYRRRRA